MNANTKLLGMGFRKTKIHKPKYQSELGYSIMVLDNEEVKFDSIGRKSIVVEKNHPKSDSFYKLEYNDIYSIWVLVKSFDISIIWLYNSNGIPESKKNRWVNSKGERLYEVYNINDMNSYRIESGSDILGLLPKEVRRDFILNKLFK